MGCVVVSYTGLKDKPRSVIVFFRKGGSLIRMMEHFLTQETFTLGVRNYLKKNSYQNVEKDDLWNALTHVSQNQVLLASVFFY